MVSSNQISKLLLHYSLLKMMPISPLFCLNELSFLDEPVSDALDMRFKKLVLFQDCYY